LLAFFLQLRALAKRVSAFLLARGDVFGAIAIMRCAVSVALVKAVFALLLICFDLLQAWPQFPQRRGGVKHTFR
jgi:hypothetical protein